MEYADLIKHFKKKPLIDMNSPEILKVDYNKNDIIKILPNREPFLFIDKIIGIDLKNKIIAGKRKISMHDPVFKGHFPNMPVYPGVLQLEMISEIFSCLYYFISKHTTEVFDTGPINLRAIRMHDALLQHALYPGDEVIISAKEIECNGLTFKGIGQIIKGSEIPVLVIGEFYIIE